MPVYDNATFEGKATSQIQVYGRRDYGKQFPSPRSAPQLSRMTDYLRTALLLEEKAAKLPLHEPRRAYLLAIARAARLMGVEQFAGGSPQPQPGTLGKRAEVYAAMMVQSDGCMVDFAYNLG